MKRRQLEKVAKNWCLTIRASQVIPVYPLREDLLPGDVFLVTRPIQAQHKEYLKRGFLALDQQQTRLMNLDYPAFYSSSYGTRGKNNTPYHWQFPPDGDPSTTQRAAGIGSGNAGSSPDRHTDPTDWNKAPLAAFPAYTFEVSSSGGIAAAIPIQGVPTALSMMQTDKASGSVTLSDAYTYGMPYDMLDDRVRTWAARPDIQRMLKYQQEAVAKGSGWGMFFDDVRRDLTPNANPRTAYVRVISRVYVVGKVHVVLLNARKGSFKADVGVPKQLTLPEVSLPNVNGKTPGDTDGSGQDGAGADDLNPNQPEPEQPEPEQPDVPAVADTPSPETPATGGTVPDNKSELTAYQSTLKQVSESVGGSAELEWASKSSVAMNQTFRRPLVVGYLSFDYPVLKGGRLGYPVATLNQLESGAAAQTPLSREAVPYEVAAISLETVRSSLEEFSAYDDKASDHLDELDGFAREAVTFDLAGLPATFSFVRAANKLRLESPDAVSRPVDFGLVTTRWAELRNSVSALENAKPLAAQSTLVVEDARSDKSTPIAGDDVPAYLDEYSMLFEHVDRSLRTDRRVIDAVDYYVERLRFGGSDD